MNGSTLVFVVFLKSHLKLRHGLTRRFANDAIVGVAHFL
jgi:hypothetical protein